MKFWFDPAEFVVTVNVAVERVEPHEHLLKNFTLLVRVCDNPDPAFLQRWQADLFSTLSETLKKTCAVTKGINVTVGNEHHRGVNQQHALSHAGGTVDGPAFRLEVQMVEDFRINEGATTAAVFDGIVNFGMPERRHRLAKTNATKDFRLLNPQGGRSLQ